MRRARCLRCWAAVALGYILIVISSPNPVSAQDSTSSGVGGSIRVYPGALYSSTVGVGVGLGYKFTRITGPGSSLLLVGKPSVHRGIYELSYASAEAYGPRPHLGASVYYEDSGRTRYYGTGPFSSADRRLFIEDVFFRIRGRATLPVRKGRFVVQPVAEYLSVRTDTFLDDDAGAFDALSPDGRATLLRAVQPRGVSQHAGLGVEAGWYLSRDPSQSGSGFQITFDRLIGLGGDAPGFWRVSGIALLDEKMGGRHFLLRLAFAGLLGDMDDAPYYLLPSLGGRLLPGYGRDRFRGASMLAMNAAIEQPLAEVFSLGGVDLVLMVGAGNVYDSFARQFSPTISTDSQLDPGARAPLRPAGALGFRFYAGSRPFELTVLAGLSPERLSLVTFRVHRDIRHRQGLLFR